MPSTHKSVSAVVSRAADNQKRPFPAHVLYRIGLGDGHGDTQTGQFHQLIDAELVFIEELLVYVDGLFLAVSKKYRRGKFELKKKKKVLS